MSWLVRTDEFMSLSCSHCDLIVWVQVFNYKFDHCLSMKKYEGAGGEDFMREIQKIESRNRVSAMNLYDAVLSIRTGSRPKELATGQTLAVYFRLTLP